MQAQTEKLEAIRTIKAGHVVDYFHSIRDHLLTFAERGMTLQAMRDFRESLPAITADTAEQSSRRKQVRRTPPVTRPNLEDMRRQVRAYYENDFLRNYDAAEGHKGHGSKASCPMSSGWYESLD